MLHNNADPTNKGTPVKRFIRVIFTQFSTLEAHYTLQWCRFSNFAKPRQCRGNRGQSPHVYKYANPDETLRFYSLS